MKNLEMNKIFGALLLVAFVIVFSQNFIDHFYDHLTHEGERKDTIVSSKSSESRMDASDLPSIKVK
jgi:hypothetical protein